MRNVVKKSQNGIEWEPIPPNRRKECVHEVVTCQVHTSWIEKRQGRTGHRKSLRKMTIGNNEVHVRIEYLHYIGLIGSLKRKKSFPPSLMDNGGERSVLENSKVDRTLNLVTKVMKWVIETIMFLLTMQTLHWEVS